jgi:DNA-binding response OmpR family regulator
VTFSISHTLREGLGLVHENVPDIVILDNNLPDGLGWPAARNILDAVPGVHLFLISANKHGNKVEYNHNKIDVMENPYQFLKLTNF